MRYKYLGVFTLDLVGFEGEDLSALVPEDEEFLDSGIESNWFDLDQFMRSLHSETGFDALMTESNVSSIGLKIIDDTFKLWRLM